MNQCKECIHNEVCRYYGLSDDIPCDFREVASADVAPVRHGRWIMNSDRPDTIICMHCAMGFDVWKHESKYFHYCPNCGAKMDGGESDGKQV